jgi:hypothetical protein
VAKTVDFFWGQFGSKCGYPQAGARLGAAFGIARHSYTQLTKIKKLNKTWILLVFRGNSALPL